MDSPAPVQRPGRLRSFLLIIEHTVSRSYTIQCLLLLHCLSWSAESRIHVTLLISGLVTIIYFYGCRHLARLVYEIAVIFSFFVVVLKAVLAISFIFALYEVILNILGYHSEDYKLFKHKIELLIIEFSSVTCTLVLNTTADGTVVLGSNDVINLCHTIWYILYVLMIAMGLYMGMPRLERIHKDNFWTNVYFTVLMVVVWKMLESLLFNGLWQSAEIRRASCVYVHYIRYGEAGFKSSIVKQ
jgi:hypothetical protein